MNTAPPSVEAPDITVFPPIHRITAATDVMNISLRGYERSAIQFLITY